MRVIESNKRACAWASPRPELTKSSSGPPVSLHLRYDARTTCHPAFVNLGDKLSAQRLASSACDRENHVRRVHLLTPNTPDVRFTFQASGFRLRAWGSGFWVQVECLGLRVDGPPVSLHLRYEARTTCRERQSLLPWLACMCHVRATAGHEQPQGFFCFLD